MIKLKEILRLKYEAKLSVRQIGSCLSLSIGVISKYVQRADAAGLGWLLPDDVSDQVLKARLQSKRMNTASPALAEPDFEVIALGQSACEQGISVRYYRSSRLFETLTVAHGDGSFGRLLAQLAKTELLIIDDWGLSVHALQNSVFIVVRIRTKHIN